MNRNEALAEAKRLAESRGEAFAVYCTDPHGLGHNFAVASFRALTMMGIDRENSTHRVTPQQEKRRV